MTKQTRREIYITCNGKSADDMVKLMTQHLSELDNEIKQLVADGKGETKECKEKISVRKQLSSQLKQNISDTQLIDKVTKNLAQSSTKQLRSALAAVRREMERTSESSGKLPQLQKQFSQLKAQIDKNTGAVHNHASSWQTAMKNLTAYVGMFTLFNKAKSLMKGVIDKNFEYSGTLTDIRKVSGLAMEDVNKLSDELAKIDTRTSTEGLAKLAYEGAKLGMSQYGVEGMAGFVRAADQINVAIGEEMGEKALPALSKMVEVMGLIPKMGIEKAMIATGSAMFKLSSTSTATSGNIVEFAKRLTGVARTAGITTDQLLALGSASDSMFLMPEVSATAMSKFIVAMQKNHNLIEKDLGIQQGTIKQMYAAGNIMDAMVMVLEKMHDKGNMNVLGEIFKDLGSDGQRLVTSMVTMAKNVDMLKDHLNESKEAFDEASAVTNEYKMQNQSAIGILERANNLWEKAFVNPDGVDNVKDLAEAWYDLSSFILQSPIYSGTLHGALKTLFFLLQGLVAVLPVIINYFMAWGTIKTVAFLINLAKAAKTAAASIWGMVFAQRALNAAAKVNVYAALAGVLFSVVGTIWSYVNAANEAADAAEEAERKANAWRETLGKAANESSNLEKKLENYKRMMSESNLTQEERQKLITRFNKDFRQYIKNLGIEINNVNDLRKYYGALADEAKRATYYRMREAAKEQALPQLVNDRAGATTELMKQMKNAGLDSLGISLKDVDRWMSKGTNANAIYTYLVKALPRSQTGVLSNLKYDVDREGRLYNENYRGKGGVSTYSNKNLLSSVRWYVNSTQRVDKKDKEIDDAYRKYIPDGYTSTPEELPGTLEKDAKDKAAITAARNARNQQLRAWREELKQKQDEANAIMDNVRNFYERQVNAKLTEAISLGMDKTEQDLFVEPVRRRMNEALEQVRLAIAGQQNSWEEFKQTMDKDLIEKTDETGVNLSEGLLSDITANNIEALRAKMQQLGNSLKRPMTSITAEIFAKATKNNQSNLNLEAKQLEARRKVAQENDYTGAVKQDMYDDFNTMGYANPTRTEVADKKAFDKRKNNVLSMYEKARKEISTLYSIDVSDKEGQGLLMKFLFGNDADGMGKRISDVLGDSAADWQVFYQKLIQYSDNYTEAEKKKYDQQKKITDQMWALNQRNLAQQEKLRKMQNESNLFGKRTNMWSNLGLADLTADPEVELMKARMQAAEDYYAFIELHSKNDRLRQEADTARQQAELNYANQMATSMKNRLSQMKELVQPIEDFGAAMGQALATMEHDTESANEAIKSALKSMLESWGKMALNDVNTQMWKAINDAGAKRGRAKAQPGIDAARANAKAESATVQIPDIGTASNPAHVIVDGGIPENSNTNGENGIPVAATPTNNNGVGNATGNAASNNPQGAAPARAEANRNRADGVGNALTGTGSAVGGAVADAVTGGGGIGDVAGGAVTIAVPSLMGANLGGSGKKDKKEEKERKKQLKEEKKHQKELSKEVKQGSKEREKATEKGSKAMTESTEQGNENQLKSTQLTQDAGNEVIKTGMNLNLTAKKANDKAVVEESKDTAQAETTFSIAGAIGKCFEFLGPIAGPIAAAVVMSTLTGIMQWALSKAFGSSSDTSSSSSTNTKLKTGMLTYDSGNVQDLKPFVADNGEVYWAEEEATVPRSGVNLLSTPTATTINGQRSLVAENGPELVIGRETTKAMMMNNPSLLRALVNYDSNYSGRGAARRAFDEGNLSDLDAASAAQSSIQTVVQNAASDVTNAALLKAVNLLISCLQQPLSVNMFGRGGLYESMNKANQFMKGK